MPAHSLIGSLLDPVLGLVSSVPIAGPIVAGAVGSVTGSAGPEGEVGILGGEGSIIDQISGVARSVIDIPASVLNLKGSGAVDITGFSGGNGRHATRTTVETLDVVTGQIVKIKRMPGSPHLMNNDISAAKKVFRATAKLHARMPRRTVKESEVEKLKKAAVQKAIRITQGDSCLPAKC